MLLEPEQRRSSACRLQDAEAELILEAFKDFWDAEEKASKAPSQATTGSPSEPPADSGPSAEEQPSGLKTEGLAGDGSCKAADNGELSQQGKGKAPDLAANVEGASSVDPHSQGSCSATETCTSNICSLVTHP